MTRIFVVETSYLCEFYALPGFSNAEPDREPNPL